MLAKIPELPADAVAVDLEDGVAPAGKAHARDALRQSAARAGPGVWPPWALRINPPATADHEADLRLAVDLRPRWVILPKAENPEAVGRLARRCASFDASVGLMIETSGGVGRVRDLACADPRVEMLIFGSADYRLSIGARPDPSRQREMHALQEILLAARMHGRLAVDSVYFRFTDEPGLRRDARVSRDLGYDGKSCIHPGQIEPIHDVFRSTPEEVGWARAVLEAWKQQAGDRAGVVVLEGEMIEGLHLDMARRILDRS